MYHYLLNLGNSKDGTLIFKETTSINFLKIRQRMSRTKSTWLLKRGC